MDPRVLADYLPLYVDATLLTLRIAIVGIALSLVVGIICAAIIQFRIPVLRQLALVYIELSRNTPLLVQLFFIYFGLPKLGITWSGEVCAIAGLTFLGGSYMAESLRAGLHAVDKIQWESAESLGLNAVQTLRYVTLPQAAVVAFPSVTANMVFLIKETSVVSVVALADLVYVARDLIGVEYNTTEALFLLVMAYLIILLPLSLLARYLEGRVRRAGFAA